MQVLNFLVVCTACDYGENYVSCGVRRNESLVLCLSGQGEPPELFVVSSSGGLRLEVISQRSQKGTERLSEIFALCLSPQGEPPPLFVVSSSGGLTLEVISQVTQKGTERLSG